VDWVSPGENFFRSEEAEKTEDKAEEESRNHERRKLEKTRRRTKAERKQDFDGASDSSFRAFVFRVFVIPLLPFTLPVRPRAAA
jgi:hypothetical protein